MTSTEELQAQIQLVSRARIKALAAQEKSRELFEKVRLDNAEILAMESETKESVAIEEARLRELTLAIFKETGEKHPAPEVGIREVDKLIYEPLAALFWATEHKLALKLDTPAFEKIVKASPANFPFVDIDQVATATIATNIPAQAEQK